VTAYARRAFRKLTGDEVSNQVETSTTAFGIFRMVMMAISRTIGRELQLPCAICCALPGRLF
jgi:hypothetical protein